MKIIINCPDSTRLIGVQVTGGCYTMWGSQALENAEDGKEITLEEPESEE